MEFLIDNASAFDFAEALDDTGNGPCHLTPARFGLFARQVAHGGAVTIRTLDKRLVIITGLYPVGDYVEAWWAMGPALRETLRPAMRFCRRFFEALGADCAPMDVRAHVVRDSVAGDRIARLLGLAKVAEVDVPPFGPMIVCQRVF